MIREKSYQQVINVSSLTAGGYVDADIDYTKYYKSIAITVRVTYGASATAGIRVYLLTSPDGSNYDSENVEDAFTYFEPSFSAGETRQTTYQLEFMPKHLRIRVRNLDSAHDQGAIKVWITFVEVVGD